MAKTKSIQRSLKLIKEYEWNYWITEVWNHYARKRIDLFNFCDILCLDDTRTIAIQAMGSDYQNHVSKIRENEFIMPWLQAGNELQLWSWRKYLKKRGGKAKEWRCKITDVLLHDNEIYFEERR